MSATEAARWMAGKFAKAGELAQSDAVDYIERHWPSCVYCNDSGGLAIGKDVLAEFRRLTEATAVWNRQGKYWRHRGPSDTGGRQE